MQSLITDLTIIQQLSQEREAENDAFRSFLKNQKSESVDELVHAINNEITPKIDCTTCGNCCKSLMININTQEAEALAAHLSTTVEDLKEKYIEESLQGRMIMNTIPCHFLSGTKCSVYEYRFEGCRDFPHLHQNNFSGRLFGILMHYAMCPIIFNVVEELKIQVGFRNNNEIFV
ncbi:MAG: YkgJ family cysteine cluster protein [Sphingobacteriales bacterium]|nr:YkgJ family cysteine cluster protein [Sphingobacteriales bacterium]